MELDCLDWNEMRSIGWVWVEGVPRRYEVVIHHGTWKSKLVREIAEWQGRVELGVSLE